jgi:hypothetical protein
MPHPDDLADDAALAEFSELLQALLDWRKTIDLQIDGRTIMRTTVDFVTLRQPSISLEIEIVDGFDDEPYIPVRGSSSAVGGLLPSQYPTVSDWRTYLPIDGGEGEVAPPEHAATFSPYRGSSDPDGRWAGFRQSGASLEPPPGAGPAGPPPPDLPESEVDADRFGLGAGWSWNTEITNLAGWLDAPDVLRALVDIAEKGFGDFIIDPAPVSALKIEKIATDALAPGAFPSGLIAAATAPPSVAAAGDRGDGTVEEAVSAKHPPDLTGDKIEPKDVPPAKETAPIPGAATPPDPVAIPDPIPLSSLPPPGRLESAEYRRIDTRLAYLARKYDPDSLEDQAFNLFTGALNDPAKTLTPSEIAEREALKRSLMDDAFPPPTADEARVDAMLGAPLSATAYDIAGLAGADQKTRDAVLTLGSEVLEPMLMGHGAARQGAFAPGLPGRRAEGVPAERAAEIGRPGTNRVVIKSFEEYKAISSGKLQPRTIYEFEGREFETDALARSFSTRGLVDSGRPTQRLPAVDRAIGQGPDADENDVGLHRGADALGFPGGKLNVNPGNGKPDPEGFPGVPNLNQGAYKRLENRLIKLDGEGNKVYLRADAIFNNGNFTERPDGFKVTYQVNNGELQSEYFINQPGG